MGAWYAPTSWTWTVVLVLVIVYLSASYANVTSACGQRVALDAQLAYELNDAVIWCQATLKGTGNLSRALQETDEALSASLGFTGRPTSDPYRMVINLLSLGRGQPTEFSSPALDWTILVAAWCIAAWLLTVLWTAIRALIRPHGSTILHGARILLRV